METATKIATAMVMKYGMSEEVSLTTSGLISFVWIPIITKLYIKSVSRIQIPIEA